MMVEVRECWIWCQRVFLALIMSFNCCVRIYTSLSPSVGKKPSKVANFVDVFINALTRSYFQDMLWRTARYFGVGLVQSEIAMCHHWELKPSACPKRVSMPAVNVQAFSVLFLSRLKSSWKKTHHVNSVFHFRDLLSGEYLAFPHDLCNTSV